MFFSSVKEMNMLISKGMSNIYLKVTIEKNWHSHNFDFLSLKNLPLGQFLESSNLRRYLWIFKLFVPSKKTEFWEQTVYGFSIINYDVLK